MRYLQLSCFCLFLLNSAVFLEHSYLKISAKSLVSSLNLYLCSWFGFSTRANQALRPPRVGEMSRTRVVHFTDPGSLKHGLLHRLTTASPCLGQIRLQTACMTSHRRCVAHPKERLINVVLYRYRESAYRKTEEALALACDLRAHQVRASGSMN